MNNRGKIIHKALKTIDKFPVGKTSHLEFCEYMSFKNRVDKLMLLSHVLHIRSKIKNLVSRRYIELVTVEQITFELCQGTDREFKDICFLEMGFSPYTDKDIETFDLDFSFYEPELQEQIRIQVQKEFDLIESHTLELNF